MRTNLQKRILNEARV